MTRTSHAPRRDGARAFATAIVLWAVAIAALALAAIQMTSARQAAAGREALARVRAQWAARAAVENAIARLSAEWNQAEPLGGTSLLKDLATVAEGNVAHATYRIVHQETAGEAPGPADAHARINVNLMTADDLMLLPGMTEEIADAILDWVDADELPREQGAELESYAALASPFKPRNAPIRSLAELEQIRGVTPDLVRGEDWNLNGVLDPSEDDGELSWPPDNADGTLDGSWSLYITASSVDGGPSPDGLDPVDLTAADASQLAGELQVDDQQAQTLVAYGAKDGATMEELIRTPLSQLASQMQQNGELTLTPTTPTRRGGTQQVTVTDLSRDQLSALLSRITMGDPLILRPGKLNLNTADEETLEYISAIDPDLRDTLLAARDAAGGDLRSMTDLLDNPAITNEVLASLYRLVGVRSNVFQVTARGKDDVTGLEVEMTCEIDRSADPVVIRSIVIR